MVDKGFQHGVKAGQAVVDDNGVVGQVTRVFPWLSEVTLVTDKEQAVPIQAVRSGLRGVTFGIGYDGTLELRFMPVNADIQNGDLLVTSGIDGTYPAGPAGGGGVQYRAQCRLRLRPHYLHARRGREQLRPGSDRVGRREERRKTR